MPLAPHRETADGTRLSDAIASELRQPFRQAGGEQFDWRFGRGCRAALIVGYTPGLRVPACSVSSACSQPFSTAPNLLQPHQATVADIGHLPRLAAHQQGGFVAIGPWPPHRPLRVAVGTAQGCSPRGQGPSTTKGTADKRQGLPRIVAVPHCGNPIKAGLSKQAAPEERRCLRIFRGHAAYGESRVSA